MTRSEYEKAGVSIKKGGEAVRKIKQMVKQMGDDEIGKFAGMFPLKGLGKEPILVSSVDGVGTKLKIAFMLNIHHTVGQDLVNHCVNDILVHGAKPLFFLDYIATGKLKPKVIQSLVSGVLDGCIKNGCLLLGGETAEMPGFYQDNEYDIAGFIVGAVDKNRMIDGQNIREGDLLIGLPSSGLHTNGYSLARYIIFEKLKLKLDSIPEGFKHSIGEELLETHRSYLKPVSTLLEKNIIKGIVHITGGGLIDNIPRILPEDLSVVIERTWPVPQIFEFLVESGNVSKYERYQVFNMGIGMVLIIDQKVLSKLEKILKGLHERYFLIGQVNKQKGKTRVKIK